MDVNSLVDFFIVNEISKNVDAYFLSTFLYKKKDSDGGKLHMGPVWDFNLSFGNADYRDAFKTSGLQVKANPVPWWWENFLKDSTCIEEIKTKWFYIRNNGFRDDNILAIIDSLSLLVDEAQERNFERWDIIGHKIWPNYYVSNSFEGEIEYLKSWTLDRLHWLDSHLYAWNSIKNYIYDYETSVYPNPFAESFTYKFSIDEPGEFSLVLYDLNGSTGQNILDRKYLMPGEFSFDCLTPDLPASVYLLVLKLDGKIVSRKKVVKL